jgi:hypothetical protein
MTKEEFMELAGEKYENLQKLNEELNFYDYEKAFDELWTELGRRVLERNIGEIPKDHRKKTLFEPATAKSK